MLDNMDQFYETLLKHDSMLNYWYLYIESTKMYSFYSHQYYNVIDKYPYLYTWTTQYFFYLFYHWDFLLVMFCLVGFLFDVGYWLKDTNTLKVKVEKKKLLIYREDLLTADEKKNGKIAYFDLFSYFFHMCLRVCYTKKEKNDQKLLNLGFDENVTILSFKTKYKIVEKLFFFNRQHPFFFSSVLCLYKNSFIK